MDDYINRTEFIKWICNSCDGACEFVECDCMNCEESCRCNFIKELMMFPRADMHPNKVAHWVDVSVSTTGASSATCSACGAVVHDSFSSVINFCPCCGADIRGDTDE